MQDDGADLRPGVARTLLPPTHIALYTVGLNVFGFLGVAALSGYLAEGLRRADAQLQRASDQIADLQAFSRHIVDNLTSGLATTDRRGRILTFNRAAENITGTPAGLAVGREASAVLQLPETFKWLFDGTEPQAAPRRIECPFTRGDGRQIELGVSSGPFSTPSGETGSLFTFQDVTETRKQEREARVQQRLAAVGEMAAGIAHEIRNPLASMSGSIQILRQELPLTTEQAQLMDIVLRESERLNETIRSFLAYARPQRQDQTRIDVRQIITDTARLLENNADLSAAHEIIVSVPDTEAWYDADENQIRQIVWNLATNGLRAMPNGGRLRLTVGVEPADQAGARKRPERRRRASVQAAGAASGARRAERDPGAVVIIVEDEGVGIAAEELDGIFQPFRGAFARGSGLGLSIVHRIVSDYGGEVHVTSQPGEGTTVTVRLPSAVAADLAGRASVN
jgi:two-component system sensor histidine kinase PilS (NtrC family)